MRKPRIFFLVEFPDGYRSQTYFKSLIRAKKWLKHISETYDIKGKLIKVKEVK